MLPAAYQKDRGVDISAPCNAAGVQSAGKQEEVSLEDTNVWTKVRFLAVPINVITICVKIIYIFALKIINN